MNRNPCTPYYTTHLGKELLSVVHFFEWQDHSFGFLTRHNHVMGHIMIMPLWKTFNWIGMMMVRAIVPYQSMMVGCIIPCQSSRSMSIVWSSVSSLITSKTSTPSPTTLSPSMLKRVWVVVVSVIVVIWLQWWCHPCRPAVMWYVLCAIRIFSLVIHMLYKIQLCCRYFPLMCLMNLYKVCKF